MSFNANQDGNYIFTRLEEKYWQPVYVGEGDLAKRITNSHHQASEIMNKGATHVHVHLNADGKARSAEEADLLKNYPQAYAPIGCNIKHGG